MYIVCMKYFLYLLKINFMPPKKKSKTSNPQKGKSRIQVDFEDEFLTIADEKAKKRNMKRKAYIEYAAMQFVKKD